MSHYFEEEACQVPRNSKLDNSYATASPLLSVNHLDEFCFQFYL